MSALPLRVVMNCHVLLPLKCVYKANVSIAITLVKLDLEGKRGSMIQMLFCLATRLT
jgi:hypothetical protein